MKYYKVKELSDLLRVHINTVYNWIYSKELPATKIGRDYRVSQEQLDQFLKSKN